MTNRSIKGMDSAADVYKIRWAKHPIDVVNHENKLDVPVDSRMTCGPCKRFETPDHIVDHHTNRANIMSFDM